MSFLNKIKNVATETVSAAGCCALDARGLGNPGGCQCDFLDETAPTTSDFVQKPTK